MKKFTAIDLAEAQLLGFYHAKRFYQDIEGLLQGMALTLEEWTMLQKKFPLEYLNSGDIKEINEYFLHNSK